MTDTTKNAKVLTQEEMDGLFAILENAYSIKHPPAVAKVLAAKDIAFRGFTIEE